MGSSCDLCGGECRKPAYHLDEAIAAMQGWRGVDIPPEDGATCLLWSPDWIEPCIGYQCFSGGKYQWFGSQAHLSSLPNQSPTHWMPLPAPPEAG